MPNLLNYAAWIHHKLITYGANQKQAKLVKPISNLPHLITRIIYHAMGITSALPPASNQIEYIANLRVAAQAPLIPQAWPHAGIRVTRATTQRPTPEEGEEPEQAAIEDITLDFDEPPPLWKRMQGAQASLAAKGDKLRDVPAFPTKFQEIARAAGALGPSSTHQPP